MPRENSLEEKISSVRRQTTQITQALRKARGKAFTKARTQYYPNSTAAYSLRLLSLSGDVELNPGDNASRTEQTNTKTKSQIWRYNSQDTRSSGSIEAEEKWRRMCFCKL